MSAVDHFRKRGHHKHSGSISQKVQEAKEDWGVGCEKEKEPPWLLSLRLEAVLGSRMCKKKMQKI